MQEQKWYAIRTFPGYENKVKEKLLKQIHRHNKSDVISDIYIPQRKHYSFSRGKLRAKEEMLFPGYVFVKMEFNNDTFYFVRGIQHVTGYAGISSMKQTPKPMNDGEYETMIKEVENITIDLEAGDEIVIINHELYDGFIAKVIDINCYDETMNVQLCEKDEVIKIEFAQVEKK